MNIAGGEGGAGGGGGVIPASLGFSFFFFLGPTFFFLSLRFPNLLLFMWAS